MKRFLLSFFAVLALAFGTNGVFSDTTMSQYGVGFRATVTVFNTGTSDKTTLFRDRASNMGLANPFQSGQNGRFTFFAANGWYDLMVSGVGITNYTYTVFITDGTFTVGGQSSGDLSGSYPGPSVSGLVGRPLPTAALTNGVAPVFNYGLNLWQWRAPLLTFPTSTGDVTGTYPDLKVVAIHSRLIDNTNPPNEGDTVRWRGAPGKWVYEIMATSPTSMEFHLCTGVPCTVHTIAAPAYIVTSSISVSRCWITAKTPPTGANLIVDVVKLGGASIYPTGNSNKLNLAPSGGIASAAPPSPGLANPGSAFVVNIVQVGASVAGQDVTVACQIVGN